MKILILTNLYPPQYIGGYELICQTVVETLRERGHAIQILTSNHGVEGTRQQADDPAIERSLRINGLYGHPWLGIRQLARLERHNNQVLRSALERHRPDLVYVWNMGGLSKSMLLTLQGLGTPTVFYLSDHWISRGLAADVWIRWWNNGEAPFLRRMVRQACEWAGIRARCHAFAPTHALRHLKFQRLYFCSRALRDLTVAGGYDVAHGAVIYCPVHLRYFEGEFQPPKGSLERLLYVGRLAEDKGVMTALRALALLRGQLKTRLSIYGRGEPDYVDTLKRFAGERELDVTFTSADLPEMPRVYREHDLLLFTSEWAEPFALTPIEAMASGLPVVGTTTGGSAELFRHGENGLVYKAGKAEQLAERIWQFASNESLRTRCAQTGWSEARERYAAPVIVNQIEAYLRETVHTWKPVALPSDYT